MRADKQELAGALLDLAKTADGGKPKTGRRYYYLALSYGHISPSMAATDAAKAERDKAYKRVAEVLGTLRMEGRLGWHMVLDLTRELDSPLVFDNQRDARQALRRQFDEDRWIGQPHYPLLVVEKDTLEPICKPFARRWQMRFASSRGYSSLTLQHDVADALNERLARHGQDAIIYFISDQDPSGLDLERAWKDAMQDFGVRCRFHRIGLTVAQALNAEAGAGRQLSIGVKPSDSRSKNYIRDIGSRCWEVDILSPDVIRQDRQRYPAMD